jgi:hypothetical protein
MVSATTWPDPAVELLTAWQPPWASAPEVQLPVVEAVPAGGPRAPVAPLTVFGPSVPIAVECTLPVQPPVPAWQFSVAVAFDQLEAPGTVGATFAPPPGEPAGAGGVAGCCPPVPLPVPPPPLPLPPREAWTASWPPAPVWLAGWSPMVSEVVVAFCVDGAWTRGATLEASGPAEAPELVTAWQPPTAPWQVPVPVEPLGSADTLGSVPVAVLDTVPVQEVCESQLSAAPEAEAADGPDPPLAVVWSPAR